MLNEKSDLLLTTHYPLNNDCTMQDPSVIQSIFNKIVAEYSAQPICFMELGYVSSPICNEYLRTLGLRTYPNGGQDKKSWIALEEEAEKRGW